MKISVTNISKAFGTFPALSDVNVRIPSGELVALLGPSGSGKTTLLRIIAGLEVPEYGNIIFDDVDVTERPIRRRNVGFVFQNYALFPHMTVAQNIGFGLRVRKATKRDTAVRVHSLLKKMQLEGLGNRTPAELSGGQRQRVALARALAPRPEVLLLDEPFGALDARVRQDLRRWLRDLHSDMPITTVFVTHDQEEAFEVADRVVILNNGKVEQSGNPDDIYDHPANAFVMDFVGNVNVLAGRMDRNGSYFCDMVLPNSWNTAVPIPARAYIRRQDISFHPLPNGEAHMTGTITYARRVGMVVHTLFRPAESPNQIEVELTLEQWQSSGLKVGATTVASVKHARVYPALHTV